MLIIKNNNSLSKQEQNSSGHFHENTLTFRSEPYSLINIFRPSTLKTKLINWLKLSDQNIIYKNEMKMFTKIHIAFTKWTLIFITKFGNSNFSTDNTLPLKTFLLEASARCLLRERGCDILQT